MRREEKMIMGSAKQMGAHDAGSDFYFINCKLYCQLQR